MRTDTWREAQHEYVLTSRSGRFIESERLKGYTRVPGIFAWGIVERRFSRPDAAGQLSRAYHCLHPHTFTSVNAQTALRELHRQLWDDRLGHLVLYRRDLPRLFSQAKPTAPAKPAPEPERHPGKVTSISWQQASAWCSEGASFSGTTDGDIASGEVTVDVIDGAGEVQDRVKIRVWLNRFAATYKVINLLPAKKGDAYEQTFELTLKAQGVETPKPLVVHAIPSVKKLAHNQGYHHFELKAENYRVEVGREIPFCPGWGGEIVKLGASVPAKTGGLLDGTLAWAGYRWMKALRGAKHFWNGKVWERLPEGFDLTDSNSLNVGFYKSGSNFVCQIGGNWPDAFAEWDVEAAPKQQTLRRWEKNIADTWTGKFDLKRKECQSVRHACCRYSLAAKATFSKQAFKEGMLIVADGNIRSNTSLFYIDEPRVEVAAHEFGHYLGNPDEYDGADVDKGLNDDGATKGIDANSIMGQKLTTVKARHFRVISQVLAQAVKAQFGKSYSYQAVPP